MAPSPRKPSTPPSARYSACTLEIHPRLAPTPVTSLGRCHQEPLARTPKVAERSADVYESTSVFPSEYMPRANTPMSGVMDCSANIPMPTFVFGFLTQQGSGAFAFSDP